MATRLLATLSLAQRKQMIPEVHRVPIEPIVGGGRERREHLSGLRRIELVPRDLEHDCVPWVAQRPRRRGHGVPLAILDDEGPHVTAWLDDVALRGAGGVRAALGPGEEGERPLERDEGLGPALHLA
eukprot:CAMPEP_0119371994 /NCGR_PEP_ID=MMETSP1334-20130426/18058_1 /TAXON_ID=127549 /ORGANISM="Calcidiscus leptoporus, Strain RCC1130" /LENGTH=126 /DNA_ID=CAMNT_0007389377 /DNA_START=125 /DNA_END=501 /DNA_ORIENTATION=+